MWVSVRVASQNQLDTPAVPPTLFPFQALMFIVIIKPQRKGKIYYEKGIKEYRILEAVRLYVRDLSRFRF